MYQFPCELQVTAVVCATLWRDHGSDRRPSGAVPPPLRERRDRPDPTGVRTRPVHLRSDPSAESRDGNLVAGGAGRRPGHLRRGLAQPARDRSALRQPHPARADRTPGSLAARLAAHPVEGRDRPTGTRAGDPAAAARPRDRHPLRQHRLRCRRRLCLCAAEHVGVLVLADRQAAGRPSGRLDARLRRAVSLAALPAVVRPGRPLAAGGGGHGADRSSRRLCRGRHGDPPAGPGPGLAGRRGRRHEPAAERRYRPHRRADELVPDRIRGGGRRRLRGPGRAASRRAPQPRRDAALRQRQERTRHGRDDGAGGQPALRHPARLGVRRPRPLLDLPDPDRRRAGRSGDAERSRGQGAQAHRGAAERAPRLADRGGRRAGGDAAAAAAHRRGRPGAWRPRLPAGPGTRHRGDVRRPARLHPALRASPALRRGVSS